ncbi:phage antirepressor N-terminal domain-containing protein [Xenorhabdus sp. Flor]|nr:phage antirepressor N-terminal domain-containing protein [Xenorhabdus sp. Flor]
MLIIPFNESSKTINVPFYGSDLYIVNYNGEPYVPMRPIVKGIGLDWKSQLTKLRQRFNKGMVEITIPTKGGLQSMICLALRKLAGWLATINPNKVKAPIRDKAIRYQNECDDVLYEYWTKGGVKTKKVTIEHPATKVVEGDFLGKGEIPVPHSYRGFTGRLLMSVENGEVLYSQVLTSGYHVATINDFMEIAQRAGYMIIDRSAMHPTMKTLEG